MLTNKGTLPTIELTFAHHWADNFIYSSLQSHIYIKMFTIYNLNIYLYVNNVFALKYMQCRIITNVKI